MSKYKVQLAPPQKKIKNGVVTPKSSIKIKELRKGAKRPQCISDFMNKIEERSKTEFFQPNRLSDWSSNGNPTLSV